MALIYSQLPGATPISNAVWLYTDSIEDNPYQYRLPDEVDPEDDATFEASIREEKILTPLWVNVIRQGKKVRYVVIDGMRRLSKARHLGMDQVPCQLFEIGDFKHAELTLVGNAQRENPSAWATAMGIKRLMEMAAETGEVLDEKGIARKLNKSLTFVRNHLGLFNLREPIQALVRRNAKVLSSAYEIQRVTDPTVERELIELAEKGAPFKTIKAQVSAWRERQEELREAYTPPDAETAARAAAVERGQSGSMSRGRQLTGPSTREGDEECQRGIGLLTAWLPYASNTTHAKAVQLAKRILEGDLARGAKK